MLGGVARSSAMLACFGTASAQQDPAPCSKVAGHGILQILIQTLLHNTVTFQFKLVLLAGLPRHEDACLGGPFCSQH
jgi:hypothetical protein